MDGEGPRRGSCIYSHHRWKLGRKERRKLVAYLIRSNNILHIRPLRLSSDSHFRTFTVLERIVPSSACSSLFDRLSLQSYRSENNTFNVKLFPRCLRYSCPLRHFFSALALFFVHWVVLLCSIFHQKRSTLSLLRSSPRAYDR